MDPIQKKMREKSFNDCGSSSLKRSMWQITEIKVLYSSNKTYNLAHPIAINSILLEEKKENKFVLIKVEDNTIRFVNGPIPVVNGHKTTCVDDCELHNIVDSVTIDITKVNIIATELTDDTLERFGPYITGVVASVDGEYTKLIECGMWILIHSRTQLTCTDFEKDRIKEKILDRVLEYIVTDLDTEVHVICTKELLEEIEAYLNGCNKDDDPSWEIFEHDPWGGNEITFRYIKDNGNSKTTREEICGDVRLLRKKYPNLEIDTYYMHPEWGWCIVITEPVM